MGLRVPCVTVEAARTGRAFAFGLSSSNLEALKLVAVVVMVIAHVAEYVFGVREGWPIELGRIAFPLFGFAFAVAMGHATVLRAHGLVFRMALYALAAQVFTQFVTGSGTLNVLWLFTAVSAWLAAPFYSTPGRLVVRGLSLVVAFLAEFSLPGFAFIICCVRAAQLGRHWPLYVACALLAVVSLLEGSSVAVLVAPPLVVALVAANAQVPRVPGLLAPFYVAHFAVIALVRWLQ